MRESAASARRRRGYRRAAPRLGHPRRAGNAGVDESPGICARRRNTDGAHCRRRRGLDNRRAGRAGGRLNRRRGGCRNHTRRDRQSRCAAWGRRRGDNQSAAMAANSRCPRRRIRSRPLLPPLRRRTHRVVRWAAPYQAFSRRTTSSPGRPARRHPAPTHAARLSKPGAASRHWPRWLPQAGRLPAAPPEWMPPEWMPPERKPPERRSGHLGGIGGSLHGCDRAVGAGGGRRRLRRSRMNGIRLGGFGGGARGRGDRTLGGRRGRRRSRWPRAADATPEMTGVAVPASPRPLVRPLHPTRRLDWPRPARRSWAGLARVRPAPMQPAGTAAPGLATAGAWRTPAANARRRTASSRRFAAGWSPREDSPCEPVSQPRSAAHPQTSGPAIGPRRGRMPRHRTIGMTRGEPGSPLGSG